MKTTDQSQLVEIGYIAKAHGIKGELFLKLFDEDTDSWFLDVGILYIGKEEFKISKARPHQNGYILILSNVVDRNKAELLKGKTASVTESFFSEKNNTDEYFLNQIKDFEVYLNQDYKGRVSGFSSTQAHEIIGVKTESGEFEIPWVESFIKEINFEKQAINLDCPKELFEADFGQSEKKNDEK